MLHVPFANHAPGSAGVVIELTDDRNVSLNLDTEAGETYDDRRIDRTLTPPEARALAAALWHFADEAERGR